MKNNCKQVGLLSGGKWDKMHDISRRVYDSEGLAPTVHTCGGGNLEPKIVDPVIGAIRGRNPENPSDRRAGIHTEQRLEINPNGMSNTITTVQKDNVLIESQPKILEDFYANRETRVYEDASPSIRATRQGLKVAESNNYKVRKLTPRECWRLMGQTDKAYDLARQALMDKHYNGKDKASSQLYKQAGNSIVVQVLEAVFEQIKGLEIEW